MLHHIAYASAAPEPVGPDLLASLLEISVRNNMRDGLSGVLLYQDQSFFQVLEGEKNAVERCYARILGDARHVGVLRLWSQPVDERVFAQWPMGYAGPEDAQRFDGAAQDSLLRFLRLRSDAPSREPVGLALTRQMYKRFRFAARYSGPILA